ncbi:hypothetical protein V8D89_000704 [Ganoderma adspersum]
MFMSTSTYWAFILRNTFTFADVVMSSVVRLASGANSLGQCVRQGGSCNILQLWSNNSPLVGPDIFWLASHAIAPEYCVGTVALTTNIIIGDIIVLGRVYVPRPRTRLVYLIFIILFLGTVATGTVSTTHSCLGFRNTSVSYVDPAIETAGVGSFAGPAAGNLVGSFFEGDPCGIAASVLSLATNAMSTCFIGYRAWEHRALVRGNGLKSFLGRSQVSRALTLLIESGAFYSTLWIIVVVYQFITNPAYEDPEVDSISTPHSSAFRAFTACWEVFTEGGLVFVVAIYPMVIMLLAALNRSECDNIASYRGNDQSDGAAALPSVVFRGSALVHAQSLDFAGDSHPVPQRAPHEAASESSLADFDTVDCSSERGFSSSVVCP